MSEKGFANGYGYYCAICDTFMDIELSNNLTIDHCPSCGNFPLLDCEDDLLENLIEERIDPTTMYYAFSSEIPLEGSMCPVSPANISIIMYRFGVLQSAGSDCGPEAVCRETGIDLEDVEEVFSFFGMYDPRRGG